MSDTKEEKKFLTSIKVTASLQAAVMARHLRDGGKVKDGFNAAAWNALALYADGAVVPGQQHQIPAGYAEELLQWLQDPPDQDRTFCRLVLDLFESRRNKR